MKQLVLLIMVLLALSSCDPGVHYERIIENNSPYDIWIKNNDSTEYTVDIDSMVIQSNSIAILQSFGHLGQTAQYENCGFLDSALISGVIGNDSLEVSIDLNNESNWNFTVLDNSFKGGGSCECRLTLNENNFN